MKRRRTAKDNASALTPIGEGMYAARILDRDCIVFKHDLPEFTHKKPWVCQTNEHSPELWAYSRSKEGATLNLRAKLHSLRVKAKKEASK